MAKKKLKPPSIVITKKTLDKLDACDDGIADVIKFLPARVYNDPKKNMSLARKLYNVSQAPRLFWLSHVLGVETERQRDGRCISMCCAPNVMPSVGAQMLAQIAIASGARELK